jgi:hypothetical protein
VAFLREQRRNDPAAARALLGGVFKSETAVVRTDLLAALDIDGARPAVPRASPPTGRRSCASYGCLMAMSLAPAYAARLTEAARCFARPTSGVSGIQSRVGWASAGVVFTPPERMGQNQRAAIAQLFDGFSVAEIATAAGLTADEIVAALPAGDDAILTAFFNRAARDGDEATMVRLQLSRLDAVGLSLILSLHSLALYLTRPLSVEAGRTLLGSGAWRAVSEQRKEPRRRRR